MTVTFTIYCSEVNSKLFFLLFICICLVFSLQRVILLDQFIEHYLYGSFIFILALNVCENISETSLKNNTE